MLSQVRSIFLQTRSLMMNAETLNKFREYKEEQSVKKPRNLLDLTAEEKEAKDYTIKIGGYNLENIRIIAIAYSLATFQIDFIQNSQFLQKLSIFADMRNFKLTI
jgi:hypothetical protein